MIGGISNKSWFRPALMLGSLLLPFFVISGYLFATRRTYGIASTSGDYLAIAVSVAAGLLLIALYPTRLANRLRWGILFIPISVACLWFYALIFVCVVFGDCL
jgi:hypothetical protein